MNTRTLVSTASYDYKAGGKTVARVTRKLNQDRTFVYIRLEIYCEQANELVTSEFVQGEVDDVIRNTFYSYEHKAEDLANAQGKMTVERVA